MRPGAIFPVLQRALLELFSAKCLLKLFPAKVLAQQLRGSQGFCQQPVLYARDHSLQTCVLSSLCKLRVCACPCIAAAAGGQFVGSVSSVFMCKYSKLGIPAEKDAEGRVMSTQPIRLMYAMARPGVEAAPRYYTLWLCAAAEPGLERVTFLTDLFAGR
jgi:hypothetical protein